ncbi:MAG TPA: arsenate reductase ArsC [Ignavibacteria bacterium]|nr:arsenate reductase ArsC [Ignavibacteria bacterium]HMQ98704.1 arsenate reductase ArsC [Ignavibacteria bacterium]
MKVKILVLCTGNSCRSQMAEGIISSLDSDFEVFSAGTRPEKNVNPFAIEVMKEIGLDISGNIPKNVDEFTGSDFDYVITVCDNAREICPVFTGNVKYRIHRGFEDPFNAMGTDEEKREVYRKVRNRISEVFKELFSKHA